MTDSRHKFGKLFTLDVNSYIPTWAKKARYTHVQ